MSQDWDHLLYLHYRVDPAEVRARVPEPLELDELDGTAWVSVIPLRLNHVHLRDVVPVPGTSEFTELNVRTYVSHQGIRGVYFLSIDASSRLASAVARSSFNLPYHAATMTFEEDNGAYHAVSRREGATVSFEARYRPTGQTLAESASPQIRFLADRFCMYTTNRRGRLMRGDISHLPWDIQAVEATVDAGQMLASNGVTALDDAPIMGYSQGSTSRCWPVRGAGVLPHIWPRI
jgi:uncharacterized protein